MGDGKDTAGPERFDRRSKTSSKFRVRLNLDGFETRLVPSGGVDAPAQASTPNYAAAATPRLQINLGPCTDPGSTTLPDGAKIHVVIKAGNVTYDEMFTVNGPTTAAQQTDIVVNDMKRQGWDVAVIGGQIVVYGHRDPTTGVYTPVSSGGASAGGAGQQPGALQPAVAGDNGVTVTPVPQPANP